MERNQEPLRPDDSDLEGLEARFEDVGRPSSIEVAADFLLRCPDGPVACLSLLVIGFECYTLKDSTAAICVVFLTLIFATFVILIGRSNGSKNTASIADDAGTAAEGSNETGED